MKDSKEIVLKKGDIVSYINNCGERSIFSVDKYDGSSLKDFESGGWVITKIERPTQYETIYEAPKQILDKEEKEYLEAVIRPFRDRVVYIKNLFSRLFESNVYIVIQLVNNERFSLPFFKKGTMYKGMEYNKEYTLDELGLFKE